MRPIGTATEQVSQIHWVKCCFGVLAHVTPASVRHITARSGGTRHLGSAAGAIGRVWKHQCCVSASVNARREGTAVPARQNGLYQAATATVGSSLDLAPEIIRIVNFSRHLTLPHGWLCHLHRPAIAAFVPKGRVWSKAPQALDILACFRPKAGISWGFWTCGGPPRTRSCRGGHALVQRERMARIALMSSGFGEGDRVSARQQT